jgi:hypothetical protein
MNCRNLTIQMTQNIPQGFTLNSLEFIRGEYVQNSNQLNIIKWFKMRFATEKKQHN